MGHKALERNMRNTKSLVEQKSYIDTFLNENSNYKGKDLTSEDLEILREKVESLHEILPAIGAGLLAVGRVGAAAAQVAGRTAMTVGKTVGKTAAKVGKSAGRVVSKGAKRLGKNIVNKAKDKAIDKAKDMAIDKVKDTLKPRDDDNLEERKKALQGSKKLSEILPLLTLIKRILLKEKRNGTV